MGLCPFLGRRWVRRWVTGAEWVPWNTKRPPDPKAEGRRARERCSALDALGEFLQTADYARAVVKAEHPNETEAAVARRVDLRMVVRTRNTYHVLLANGRFDQVDQLVPQIRDMAERLREATAPAHAADDEKPPSKTCA